MTDVAAPRWIMMIFWHFEVEKQCCIVNVYGTILHFYVDFANAGPI